MNLSDFSRKGGKAGTGAAKKRTTSFTAASSQKALAARWAKAKRKPRASARRSNRGCEVKRKKIYTHPVYGQIKVIDDPGREDCLVRVENISSGKRYAVTKHELNNCKPAL